jgi:hypothetical protein
LQTEVEPSIRKAPSEGATIAVQRSPGKSAGGQKAGRADPKASEKAILDTQLDNANSLKKRLLVEMAQIDRRLKPGPMSAKKPLSATKRAELISNRAKLNLQVEAQTKVEADLRIKRAVLEITAYLRARLFSYSGEAEDYVRGRAGGTDEISGKSLPPEKFSIDHIVSVDEIVKMEGWEDSRITEADRRAILSRTNNLKAMHRGANSSKNNRRWVDWKAGRRFYGEEKWKKMVALEADLRSEIQGKIKELIFQRRYPMGKKGGPTGSGEGGAGSSGKTAPPVEPGEGKQPAPTQDPWDVPNAPETSPPGKGPTAVEPSEPAPVSGRTVVNYAALGVEILAAIPVFVQFVQQLLEGHPAEAAKTGATLVGISLILRLNPATGGILLAWGALQEYKEHREVITAVANRAGELVDPGDHTIIGAIVAAKMAVDVALGMAIRTAAGGVVQGARLLAKGAESVPQVIQDLYIPWWWPR